MLAVAVATFTRCIVGAQLGALHEFLDGRLHGPEHKRRGRHAHHFECAAGLVQLLASNAQGAHIQGGDI